MVKRVQTSIVSRRERLRYGFSAACIGITVLLFLLFFSRVTQGLAAPAAPSITKSSVTSIVETNNTLVQAVAGELVTITVVYDVPSGETIYDASLRVVLPDGILPYDSNPFWSAMYTGLAVTLRNTETLASQNGALVVFPLEAGAITGPQIFTRTISARLLQNRYVLGTTIAHGTNLDTQVVLRWCDDAACTLPQQLESSTGVTTARVTAIQPALNVTYTPAPVYLDAAALGAGGGQVQLTFNTLNATGRPYAHDIVYTATLGAELTYHSSSSNEGAGAGTVITVGNTTYIVWQLPSRLGGQSWRGVVTATLPATFTIGHTFTYASRVDYETFAGDVLHEGKYFTLGTTQTLRPGVSITTKTSAPASGAMTMGDRITYTLTFRQAVNTLLQSPYYVDTLPRGFHYVSGTLTVQGATLLSYEVLEGPVVGTGALARYFENLRLNMDTFPVTTTVRQVTFSYVALNTGLDYRGAPVWDSVADMTTVKNTIEGNTTGAMLYWTPPSGFDYGNLGGNYTTLTTKANSTTVNVIQPFLANTEFAALRDGTAPVAVGDDVLLIIRLRNSGAAPGTPAHELQVCDTIPEGFEYKQTYGCTAVGGAPACPAYTAPPADSTGKICWTLFGLPRTDAATKYHELRYQVRVLPTAMPGVYSNAVAVEDYSTKAGVEEGERNYSDFPQALILDDCGLACMPVVGLAADKQAWVEIVAPMDLLTYTLWVTDTRGTTAYTGVVVTDTYDSLLSFVDAGPSAIHNSEARQLIWNLGALSIGGTRQITLTMRVNPLVVGQYVLTNTMTWESDQSVPFTVTETTDLAVSMLHVDMSGPEYTHAGDNVVYTVVYSNTGSWDNAPVTLTLDYSSYLTYVSSSLTPVSGTDNQVFVDTVPNNGNNKTLTINLVTNEPLPYTLEEIYSSVELTSSGALSQTDDWTMIVQRPVFTFHKMGPAAAAAVDGTMQYTFELINTGDYTATNVIITDTWDTATSFAVSPGWTLVGSGTCATHTIASLAPGETATINPLTVLVDSLQDSYLNQADLRSTPTTSQHTELRIWSHSIALAKTAYPVPAFPGRVLTYTLYYTNTGIGIINAVISDTLPDGFSYQGQSVANAPDCDTGWQFIHSQPNATWRCTALLQDAAGYFQIWGLVTATENTELVNVAVSEGADVPTRPIDEPLVTRVARPWLRVDKAAVPTHPVAPDDLITYTLTYENYGTDAAYNVVIKDQLPTQVEFVSCSSGCTSGSTVTWNIPVVPTGTVGSVQVVVQVKAGTGGQTAVNGDYTVECDLLSTAETESGDAVSTQILNPHVSAAKVATPALVTGTDRPITYTISYVNDGGGTLTNLGVVDVLSTRSVFFAASPECQWSGSGVGGTVTCAVGHLAQGQGGAVQIVVLAASEGLITNTAVIDSDQTPPLQTTPPTEVYYSTGGCIPPYNVNFTALPPNARAGEVITFTASASGDTPLAYAWTFGDTQTGNGQVIYHTYAVSGTYTVKLTVSNACNPAGVNVQKVIEAPGAPELDWNPASLSKTTPPGSVAVMTDTLTVSNVGTDNLLWSIEVSPSTTSWLSIAAGGAPAKVLSGFNTVPTGQVNVTVYFDPTGLEGGTYTAHLRITSNDADEDVVDIPMSFTYDPGAAELNWSPASLSKTTAPGSLAILTDTLTVSNTGNINLLWSIEVSPAMTSWLSIAVGGPPVKVLSDFDTAPTGQVDVTVYFDPAGLEGGVLYTAYLRITSNDADEGVVDIPVSFTYDPGASEIEWSPTSLSAFADEGSTDKLQRMLEVSNTGTVALTWSIEVTPTTATWLEFMVNGSDQTAYLPGLSTAPGASTPVTVYFDPSDLTPDVYTAWLRIVSNDVDEGVVLVPVIFTIQAVDEDYYIFLPLVLKNY